MSEYISIKEFAERAGVSTQAIYKQLATKLATSCKLVGNQKMLDTEALKLFDATELSTKFATELATSCKPVDDGNGQQDALAEVIRTLREQLQEKDRQLAEKDKQIEKLTTALINEQQTAQQAHLLQAGTIQAVTEAGQPKPKKFGWLFRHK